MNFASIYNPRTKKISYFIESEQSKSHLSLENFEQSTKYHFSRTEFIDYSQVELIEKNEYSISKESYTAWVEKIKSLIDEGLLTKGVAAQKQVNSFDGHLIDLQVIFKNLIQRFPNTFVYLFYIENTLWIGASPEIIGILENNQFSTISLAGTVSDANFSEKEREEQAIVSNFMEKLLSQNRKTSTEISPQIYRFGNIQHLITEHKMEVDASFDFERMIHEIHSSPALAGFPKQSAINSILEFEELKRDFYCGLAHIYETKDSQYSFALIRCAEISKNQIAFYAGAGITQDSDAEKEWEEVMKKNNTLASAIALN